MSAAQSWVELYSSVLAEYRGMSLEFDAELRPLAATCGNGATNQEWTENESSSEGPRKYPFWGMSVSASPSANCVGGKYVNTLHRKSGGLFLWAKPWKRPGKRGFPLSVDIKPRLVLTRLLDSHRPKTKNHPCADSQNQ